MFSITEHLYFTFSKAPNMKRYLLERQPCLMLPIRKILSFPKFTQSLNYLNVNKQMETTVIFFKKLILNL